MDPSTLVDPKRVAALVRVLAEERLEKRELLERCRIQEAALAQQAQQMASNTIGKPKHAPALEEAPHAALYHVKPKEELVIKNNKKEQAKEAAEEKTSRMTSTVPDEVSQEGNSACSPYFVKVNVPASSSSPQSTPLSSVIPREAPAAAAVPAPILSTSIPTLVKEMIVETDTSQHAKGPPSISQPVPSSPTPQPDPTHPNIVSMEEDFYALKMLVERYKRHYRMKKHRVQALEKTLIETQRQHELALKEIEHVIAVVDRDADSAANKVNSTMPASPVPPAGVHSWAQPVPQGGLFFRAPAYAPAMSSTPLLPLKGTSSEDHSIIYSNTSFPPLFLSAYPILFPVNAAPCPPAVAAPCPPAAAGLSTPPLNSSTACSSLKTDSPPSAPAKASPSTLSTTVEKEAVPLRAASTPHSRCGTQPSTLPTASSAASHSLSMAIQANENRLQDCMERLKQLGAQ